MPAYHSMTAAQALEFVQSSERGISEQEAQKRLLSYGENALRNKKKGGAIRLFLAQFKDFMTILLICAAVISGTVAYFTGDAHEVADTGILLFIILLNTIVGFIQQYRADTAVEKLKKLSVCQVKVLRGGKDMLLPGTQLVPGDVIWLEEGDMVPADCRILQSEDLRCDESALTGESNGVAKTPNPCEEKSAMADRKCMLYSSSFVLKGQAKALVVKTGQNTELGKIAGMLTQTKEAKTPLEKILATLGKVITVFVISVAAVIFVFGIFFKENSLLSNFMSSVAIAVAAIPEGMPAIVTVIMALGVQRMSKQRAIIRKLHAVETLGGCSCICSDKTGTLTENRMTVEEIVVDFRTGTPLAGDPLKSGHPAVRPLLECMRICNTVKGKGGKHIGDPTEVALVRYADSCAFFTDFRRLGGIPFTSERKMMTVSAQTPQGRKNYVKGGADVLLGKCTRIWTQGGIRAITQKDREEILSVTKELASRALRVLGFACSEYTGKPAEENLIFLGVCGMIDPPKQGVKEAVSQCMRAGIMPVMITGDHRDTAFAIAKRLGIAQSEEQVLTGTELDTLPEEVLNKQIPKTRVFARVSPKHKSAIVERFQKAGNVVAMTGDGINDAPGIRKADIGIAMGISGTDVTRSAADMVIADDNFSTIVSAVREGRHIFSNIKKTILFFLATNLAEVLCILIASLVLWRLEFLTSTQLLWINLITDSLPVLSLGAEVMERDCMLRPPRREGIFTRESMTSVAVYGILQTIVCLWVFVAGARAYGNAVALTMTFFVLSFLELFHSFNIRSERGSAFSKDFFSNKMLFVTVFAGIAVNLLLCSFAPVRAAFDIVPLTWKQWLIVFLSSLSIIPLAEIYKGFVRLVCSKKNGTCRKNHAKTQKKDVSVCA